MAVPVQANPFEKLRFYDSPELVVSMLLDNEATFRGISNAFFNPEGLTPKEREGIASRLKAAAGNKPLTDTLIDVATNPFVWLMFVTSPAALKGLGDAGKGIFSLASRFSADVRTNGPVLQGFRLLSPLQSFTDTPGVPALMQLSERISDISTSAVSEIEPALREYIAHQKAKGVNITRGLDPVRYRKGSPERAAVQRLQDAIAADLHRLDQDHVAYTSTLKKGKDGRPRIVADASQHRARLPVRMEEILRKEGGLGIRDAIQKSLIVRAIQLYGKNIPDDVIARSNVDELRQLFEVDTDKTRKLYEGLRLTSKDGAFNVLNESQGKEALAKIMGADVEKIAREINPEDPYSAFSQADLDELIKLTVEIPIKQNGKYLPRNVRGVVGVPLSGADLVSFNRIHTFTSAKLAIPRMKGRPFQWHHEDLDRLRREFGSTDLLDEEIGALRVQDAELRTMGESLPAYRLDLMTSFNRYNKDTAETVAFFVDDLDDAVKLKLRDQLDPKRIAEGDAIAAGRGDGGPTFTERIATARRMMGEVFDNPRNVAEVLSRQVAVTADPYASRALTDIVVPRITGHIRRADAGILGAAIQAKAGLQAFSKSRVGQAIRSSGGEFGERIMNRIDDLADIERTTDARSVERWLTKYLYTTHLGLNMGSVTLNLMQPMIHAATWGGATNVLKAYVSSIKELGGYMNERIAKHGVGFLTQDQHLELIHKHFKYSNVEGRDLLGITRSLPESLDSLTFRPGSLASAGQKESLLDFTMKFFEKAEWLNRNVAAHTVENLYKQTGRFSEVGEQATRRILDTERMVQETQFGGSILNQPLLFMQGPLSNGLLRQFLQFPTRAFTASFFTGPRLAGQESLGKGFANTFLRGLAMSAITYEVGKGLVGADLSRGLFAASTFDLFGGERFLEDGNEFIPVPPVVDIPINLVKGFINDDVTLLQTTIPRLIPGGIGIARAINLHPQLPKSPLLGLPGSLQKNYVEWTPDEEGRIPIFRGDGTLLGWEKASVVAARMLGLDLGRWKDESEMTRFLLQNRDEIVKARQEYIRRLFANDISGAMRVKAEFEKRFGVPLTVTKQQVKAAMESRNAPRTERILSRLPASARPQYAAIVERTRGSFSGQTQQAGSEDVSGQVEKTSASNPVRLDPATIQVLRESMEQKKAEQALRQGNAGPAAQRGFQGFGGF